jgi:hypothetical protein
VAPGRHDVQARLDYSRSNTLTINAVPGETVVLQVADPAGRQAWPTARGRYLRLRVAPDSPTADDSSGLGTG